MALRILSFPAHADLWHTLCQRLLADSGGAAGLAQHCVIVPAAAQRVALLQAFARLAAEQQQSLIPPRIQLLEQWLLPPDDSTAAPSLWQLQSETYIALRGNAWIRAHFGTTPAQLWALAHTLVQLSDQLCFAAFGQPADFATAFEHTVAQHYQHSGAQLAAVEARMVLEVWRNQAQDWPASVTLQRLQTVLAQPPTQALWWLSGHHLPPWQQAFLEQLGQHCAVTSIQIDTAATLAQHPLYAAAWPPDEHPAPLRERALALPEIAQPTLCIAGAASLEQEASFIAAQVIEWLQQGEISIALVALDRLTTRRVRALLERADVLLRDETGWRLSTTSAAGAVMRWFDVVRNQGHFRDVLDWLQSPFVLPQQDKQPALRLLQQGLARHGVARGWEGLRTMLATLRVKENEQDTLQQLRDWFEPLHTHAQAAEKFSGTAAQHFALLRDALAAFGLQDSLAQDPVGRTVLQLLQQLAQALETQGARMQAMEFRALLAHCFEHSNDRQDAVDSPVTVVSLNGAHLRTFKQVIVIGASADLLPAERPETLFLGDTLCTALGLPTQAQARREQFDCWLTLIASAQQVICTWCTAQSDRPQVLSPWLTQYKTVATLAGHDVEHTIALPAHPVTAHPISQPLPQAPGYWPEKLSASAYQALIDCPYRFFARSILGLTEEEEIEDSIDQRRRGQAIHAILENFHRDCARDPQRHASSAAQTELLRHHCTQEFAPLLALAPDYLGWQMEFEQLIPDYLRWWAAHRAEGWQWQKAEEKMQHTLQGGAHALLLNGRIDRIDRHLDTHAAALIDYKTTAAADLKKSLKIPGEKIQLPFYALLQQGTAQDESCSASYLSLHSTGVRTIAPEQAMQESSRTLAVRLLQDVTRIHAGAALPAQGIDTVCQHCEVRGLCRRDEWKTTAEGA